MRRVAAVAIAALLLTGCPGGKGQDESQATPPRNSTTTPANAVNPGNSSSMNPAAAPQKDRLPAAASTSTVQVQLTEYEIQMPDTLPAGHTTFNIANAGKLNHNFAIEGPGVQTKLTQDLTRGDTQQIGVDLKVENLSSSAYSAREQTGRFQLAYGSTQGGPSPYYELGSVLHSANSAPVGQAASSNYERWKDKTTDRLLDDFASTTSSVRQHAILDQLQGIMLQDVPVIPVLEGVTWYQYDTSKLIGWPTASNPYANPGPCATPDWEVVLLNVHLR